MAIEVAAQSRNKGGLMGRPKKRHRLIEAAKVLLLEKGWHGTSAEVIRKREAVSSGSWVHIFNGGKVEIAGIVFLEMHAAFWDTALELLRNPSPAASVSYKKACHVLSSWFVEDRARAKCALSTVTILYAGVAHHVTTITSRFFRNRLAVAIGRGRLWWVPHTTADRPTM
jgi:hypothetical protein